MRVSVLLPFSFLIFLTISFESSNCLSTQNNNNNSTEQNSTSFNHFKVKFSKKYKNSESHLKAQRTYEKNVAKIHAHNAIKSHSYVQGENHMTDMSYEDVIKNRTGSRKRSQNHSVKANTQISVKSTNSIGSLDLRNEFPPIQDQGSCGSCWAFTATALVDNFSYKNGLKTKYSEQFLLDCSGGGRSV